VTATLYATESTSDIGVLTPYLWVSQGATVSIPITARVLSNGAPQSGAQVNFDVLSGSGTFSAANAQTDSSGYATVTLTVTQLAALVQGSACVAPANAPCHVFYVNPVTLSNQHLQPVAGAGQVSTGQPFQPVVVRVVDSSLPPNSVLAATVGLQTTVLRPGGAPPAGGDGETNTSNPAMPVILSVSQSTAATDVNGLASIVPASAGFSAPLEIDVGVIVGTGARLDYLFQVLPILPDGNTSTGTTSPPRRLPVGIRRPMWTKEGRVE
jgi:hypothetical protein